MRLDSRTAGLFTFAAVLGGLGYIIFDSQNDLRDRQAQITEQVEHAQQKIDRIETLLAEFNGRNGQSSFTPGSTGGTADIEKRLAALEQRLLGPWIADPSREDDFTEHQVYGNGTLKQHLVAEEDVALSRTPAEAFKEDSGASDWGKTSASQISQAYDAEPYFGRFGGVLETDCKSNTCRVAWTVTNADLDDMEFAMAEYELMAVATRNDDSISRVQTERRVENGRTIIYVYATR